MRSTGTLSRTEQFSLNSRALWRDVCSGHFSKLRFHLRGCLRALIT